MLGPSDESAVEALFVTVNRDRVKHDELPKQENMTDFVYALMNFNML